ncbi:unnamed protein product [Cunninghamella blakesleeana]
MIQSHTYKRLLFSNKRTYTTKPTLTSSITKTVNNTNSSSRGNIETITNKKPLRGWRKYTEQFKDKPASYITTFAILHEVTAIIPFPIVYYGLSLSNIHVPVPEEAVREGNRIVNKVRVRYGYEPLESDNRTMVYLATTYGIVKILLPLRIGASIALTPYFAEKWVGPFATFIKTFIKRFK